MPIAEPTIAEHALSDTLCRLLPRLRRFARSLTGNGHDADDLVQVALERAWARASQWRPEQGGEGWLFGIVRNAWIDEVRSRQRGVRLFAPEADGEQVGEASMERQSTAMSVTAALARLPEEQRLAVALVLVEGLSYQEAAEAMAVPIGTLTSRLARGRERLQQLLGDDQP